MNHNKNKNTVYIIEVRTQKVITNVNYDEQNKQKFKES